MQWSYYTKCIKYNWSCVIHLIHVWDKTWGPSCPTSMGTVLPHTHGDRLASHAWGPSCPTCMGTVLPHIHGDRLAPHAWGLSCPTCMRPSCPTCMGTVLPHMHGDRLAPHAWGPFCPTRMGTVLPHTHYVCLNTIYTKHTVLLPTFYCLTCQPYVKGVYSLHFKSGYIWFLKSVFRVCGLECNRMLDKDCVITSALQNVSPDS